RNPAGYDGPSDGREEGGIDRRRASRGKTPKRGGRGERTTRTEGGDGTTGPDPTSEFSRR
ncbi:hypothetical protein LTS01_025546, partial [Friedmanniomyces endolithicus]